MFVRLTKDIKVAGTMNVRPVVYRKGLRMTARKESGFVLCLTPECGVFDLEVYDGEYEVVGR